jgi:heat shock protein HtpX
MNNLKTVGLLAFMTALLFSIVYLIGGNIVFALILAFGFNFFAFFFSDKMALKASRAKPVTEAELPEVYAIMRRLTQATGMPMPTIHLIDSPQPNAFATGRSPKKAAVAVTTGIMDQLTRDELEGVLAHELAHVKNRDILVSSIAAMLGAAIAIIARFAFFGGGNRNSPLGAIGGIIALIVAPLAAMVIRFAISRTREFQADRTGAEITGQPMQLASALDKISEGARRRPMKVNPATSQLFIENPMKGVKGQGITRLLSTHPPTAERVERLTNMAMGIS